MRSAADHLIELVKRPSVNPMGRTDIPAGLLYESRVGDYLESVFREIGAEYRRVPVAPGRDNLIATYAPPSPAGTILWEAHLDTVPVDGMTIDPFGAVIQNGRLSGRGACDVKGGGAAMLAAFSRLVAERPACSPRVILAYTVDEEHTFLGVQHLIRSGLTCDFAVVAEPTNLDLVTSHKGVARWSVETSGIACHSSRPEQGINAVYRMAKLLGGIEAYASKLRRTRSDPALGEPTLSVGRIEGGTSPNTVPDFCRVEIDRRLLPGETSTEAVTDLETWLKQFPGVDFLIRTNPLSLDCPSLAVRPSTWLDRLTATIAAVTARTPRHLAVPYGTDASTLSSAGIPSVVFGPGDIEQAHTKDEWIELAQVDQAVEILYRLATG